MTAQTLSERLSRLRQELQRLPQSEPRIEAEILLCQVLERPRSHLFCWPDAPFDPALERKLQQLLRRRLRGEPIAHITGQREFWSLPLQVTRDTLIPRPETELLVELALERIPRDRPCRVIDLGTGSGAIALAIASERPMAQISASDRSPECLQVAQGNARQLGLNQITFICSDWFAAVNGLFDLILSNPPYIPERDPHLQRGDLPWEPCAALASGADGLDAIRQITAQAPHHLTDRGWLLLEHGYDQAPSVRQLLSRSGFSQVQSWRDLAGIERVSGGRLAQPQAT